MSDLNQDVGVIIGRFQINKLHDAHKDLIDGVTKNHKRVILFLGVSPVMGTTRNPLDFTSRKKMIQEQYPEIVIAPLPDCSDDLYWSHNLDSRIREIFPMGSVVLYGGRDSFISYYRGLYPTKELEQTIYVSGTEIRKGLSDDIKSSEEWRAGVIYDSYNRYPVSYQTVDIASFSGDYKKILLAKKPGEDRYRFIGGFVDPRDSSLERAATREYAEETGGSEINNLEYIGSFRIDDWRYRHERDKIMSTLFVGTHSFGTVQPSDDISELIWLNWDSFVNPHYITNMIVPEHVPLMTVLISKMKIKLHPKFVEIN